MISQIVNREQENRNANEQKKSAKEEKEDHKFSALKMQLTEKQSININ